MAAQNTKRPAGTIKFGQSPHDAPAAKRLQRNERDDKMAFHEAGCSGRHVGRYNDVCLCRGWVWVMADGWPICKAQPSRAKALHAATVIAPSIGEGAAQGRYMLIHVE